MLVAMIASKSYWLVAALTCLGGSLLAQAKGSAPPEIEFVKVWNDCPATFEELEGKVVILDFGATW
jgi:hypothetical protein